MLTRAGEGARVAESPANGRRYVFVGTMVKINRVTLASPSAGGPDFVAANKPFVTRRPRDTKMRSAGIGASNPRPTSLAAMAH
eukprot:5667662-Pyramimonas_sp.AAC.1